MISTSKPTVLYRLDHLILHSFTKKLLIIDEAIPGDFCVKDREAEKISKYQDLALEIFQMWNVKTRVNSIVNGDSQNTWP